MILTPSVASEAARVVVFVACRQRCRHRLGETGRSVKGGHLTGWKECRTRTASSSNTVAAWLHTLRMSTTRETTEDPRGRTTHQIAAAFAL